MENNKFFTWVWRLNGIIILLASIVISGTALFALYESMQRGNQQEEVIDLAEDPTGIEKWVLGRATNISGTDTLMLSLISENKEVDTKSMQMFSGDYYSRSSSHPAKNILFLNTLENQSFWLFKNTSQLVLSAAQFPSSYSSSVEEGSAIIIFYQVVTNDTNSDGILNYKDKSSLAITATDGTGYKVIIEEFDRIISKNPVGADKIVIVFQNKGIGYSMLISINPYEVISTNKIPRVKDS